MDEVKFHSTRTRPRKAYLEEEIDGEMLLVVDNFHKGDLLEIEIPIDYVLGLMQRHPQAVTRGWKAYNPFDDPNSDENRDPL